MHRRFVQIVCVVALLSVPVTSVLADREVVVRPFDYEEITPVIIGPVDPTSTCQVGNLNSPAWIIHNFLLPPEEYKFLFRSRGTCTNCEHAFSVDRIHVLLETQESCTVTMSLNVDKAEEVEPGCLGPGQVWCDTGTWAVLLPDSGVWDVNLPLGCPCLSQRYYLLSFSIDDFSCATGTTPGLITDASPDLCTNWNNIGSGWYDMFDMWPTWPGNLIFWADASCCSPPVPVELGTWGAIKSLYID